MTSLNDRKLLSIIRYAPAVFIGIFAIVVNIILIQNNRIESAEKIQFVRESLIDQQKKIVEEQVNQIVNRVEREKSLTVKKLQEQLKNRVYEAYNIVSNIYQNHPNESKAEVSKLIVEAIRPIRFNGQRGYFFIFDGKGMNVLHSTIPELEGTSVWDIKDIRGSLIVQEHIQRVDSSGGEAFYGWWYKKPNDSEDLDYEKIGFGKYFEPYDWYIGTGDYVVDVENDIKLSVLAWLSQYRYGDDDYVFVIDKNQNLISHPDPSLLNQRVTSTLADQMTELLGSGLHDSGFARYVSRYTPGEVSGGDKISYMKVVEDWGWVVGTGFYIERFEQHVADSVKALEASNAAELRSIVFVSVVSTLLIIGMSLKLGNVIGGRFNRFQERISKDFAELEHVRDKLKYLAEHDSLTDLPNRLVLTGIIHSGIDYAQKHRCVGAVMLLDLDDFKKINDLHGHSSGDKLLTTISRKFETLLGPHDTVSRFGGDEFIFCFPTLANEMEARVLVAAISDVFKDKFIIDGKVLVTNCSIGVSMFPTDDNDPEGLIRKADVVLYKSKALKKGSAMFYNNDINDEIQLDYVIEEELRKALREEEISVVYQPQIEVSSGQMIGVEALCRWNNARLGAVSPVKFVAIAEEIGVIHEIGLFVFRKSCEDILSVFHNGPNTVGISVNISPKQLIEPNFCEMVTEMITDVGIDVSRVTIEITENVLLDDLQHVSMILNKLRRIGFGLSLDDFGTGYSSLSYLNNLPITEIKIDRSFVDRLLESEQTNTLVKAIIAIGESCQMKVVAEGVENLEQFEALSEYGCDVVQGYYFDRPLTIDTLRSTYYPSLLSCQSNSDQT